MNNTDREILDDIVDVRENAQRQRIAYGNRLAAIERGDDTTTGYGKAVLKKWHERFQMDEEEATNDILEIVDGLEIVDRAAQVKGVGRLTAALVIVNVDIREADTVSALWRYCGYGVGEYWVDENGKTVAPKEGVKWVTRGKKKERVRVTAEPKPGWTLKTMRDRRVSGWCIAYNSKLKPKLYNIGTQLIRKTSPYRKDYEEAREQYDQRGWTSGHAHMAALRVVIKLWLQHLWIQWRSIEGLETNMPYVIEADNGHNRYKSPEEYGWPEL